MRIFCFKNSGRDSDPDGQIQDFFGEFGKSLKHRATAGHHNAGARLSFIPRASDLVPNEMDDLFGARLKDVAQNLLGYRPGLPRAHADNLKHIVLVGH